MNFSLYWQHADVISKGLFFILLLMSVVSWVVFILRVNVKAAIDVEQVSSISSSCIRDNISTGISNGNQMHPFLARLSRNGSLFYLCAKPGLNVPSPF